MSVLRDVLDRADQLLAQPPRLTAENMTPGQLALAIDPTTRNPPHLQLLDQLLIDVDAGRVSRALVTMPPQEGKALALDTPIATPSGWTSMGALAVGDQVFDRHGEPCSVTWVSPIWRDRECFAVRTGDGERIISDAEHEWPARLDRRHGEHLHTSRALAWGRSKNAQITGVAALNLPDADLPLDPYVLGAWLGDGTTLAPRMTLHPDDVDIRDRFAAAGWPLRQGSRPTSWTMAPAAWAQTGARHGKPSPARAALVAAGVFGRKHIPVAYMRGSEKQRLALLQGLIDTDGYVDPSKGIVEFCTTLPRLAAQVRELVFTLGAKATVKTGRATINGRDCGLKYRVRFMRRDAAWMSRKAERCRDSSVGLTRYVWAEPCERCDTVCIEVDSPDHTFLAGRSLLPTHNSQRMTRFGTLWALRRNPDRRIGIVSYEADIATRWGRIIRDDLRSNQGGDDTLNIGLALREDSRAAGRWEVAGHRGGVYCVGVGGALTGRPIDWLVIDDPIKNAEQADSPTYRERVWDMWTHVGLTRLSPGAPAIVILTRWHRDDLAGRLLAQSEQGGEPWTHIHVPAVAEPHSDDVPDDALGREPGVFIQSALGRTADDWQKKQREVGPRAWAALYQGRPSPPEGNLFKAAELAKWRVNPADLPSFVTVREYIDPAFSIDNPDADETGRIVVGLQALNGSDPVVWVLADLSERSAYDHLREGHIGDTHAVWGTTVVKAERNLLGKRVLAAIKADLPHSVRVEGISARGTKAQRAEAANNLILNGRVRFAGTFPALEDQMLQFNPLAVKDSPDRVDALVHGIMDLLAEKPVVRARVVSAVGVSLPTGAAALGRNFH